jgi:beta-1,4-mannosyl-glycoprotein beta-1,4-N-acetylglucosaminyltransferase
MRIVDCFPYFNEKELLELRINLLYDKVDQFIICDANKTHKGTSKPFTCKQTLENLGLLTDKVQVLELNLPSYEEEPNPWVRERLQRNAAANFIQDNDMCIISDCDEIINPDVIDHYINIAKQYSNNIVRIPIAFLNGRADLRVYTQDGNPVPWTAPYVCSSHHLKKYTLSEIRESHARNFFNIDYIDIFTTTHHGIVDCKNGIVEDVEWICPESDSGWHFGWMGGINKIKEKSESFLHWNDVSVQDNYIAKEESVDPLGRSNYILKKYNIDLLPPKLFQLENVKNFLLPIESQNKIKTVDKPRIKITGNFSEDQRKTSKYSHFFRE